jgi:hypothetical protein
VRLIDRVWSRFGDDHYPAFLHLLCAIQQFGNPRARAIVADTLAAALATARMPAGRLSAWGAAGGSAARRVGPIEFLCAWHAQTGSAYPLPRADFEFALQRLIELFSASEKASRLYVEALLAQAGAPIEGAFSRPTRILLESVARRWRAGEPAARIASQATATTADPQQRFGAPAWQPR